MANAPTRLALLAGALALGVGFITQAADAPAAPALVSGAGAAMLAETCAGCHGTDGASVGPASPTLAGMDAAYFTELMQGFRDGKIYSTIMGRIAKGYSDEEFELMAGYFHGKPYVPAKQPFDQALAAKGKKFHDKFCEKCHSEGGAPLTGEAKAKAEGEAEEEEEGEESGGEEYQILAGQWIPYLVYAMEDFRADRREMPKKMKSKLKDLITKEGENGLMAIYAYYASQQ